MDLTIVTRIEVINHDGRVLAHRQQHAVGFSAQDAGTTLKIFVGDQPCGHPPRQLEFNFGIDQDRRDPMSLFDNIRHADIDITSRRALRQLDRAAVDQWLRALSYELADVKHTVKKEYKYVYYFYWAQRQSGSVESRCTVDNWFGSDLVRYTICMERVDQQTQAHGQANNCHNFNCEWHGLALAGISTLTSSSQLSSERRNPAGNLGRCQWRDMDVCSICWCW